MHPINTVARAKVDPHFYQPAPKRPDVARIFPFHPPDARSDSCLRALVTQPIQPVPKFISLQDAYGSHHIM